MDRLKKEVKISAIKAAKEKAGELASALGQSTGRAIYIQELENSYQNVNPANSNILIRGANALYGSSAPEPEIDFEKILLQSSILCRFELK